MELFNVKHVKEYLEIQQISNVFVVIVILMTVKILIVNNALIIAKLAMIP